MQYTVTKADQNEALLMKIAVLGWKSPLLVPEHFPLAYAGILQSSMSEDMLSLHKKFVNICSEQSESFKCFS